MSTADVSTALLAKSDQLNADDLLDSPIVIEITKVVNLGKGKEQPLIISYKGDDGKPWKPCKSMGRVMAEAWKTKDGNKWIGRLVRLYRAGDIRQPDGTIGGGIRITHQQSLSHIAAPMDILIPVSRGKKSRYHVEPLVVSSATAHGLTPAELYALKTAGRVAASQGVDALKAWWKSIGGVNQNLLGAAFLDDLKAIATNPKDDGFGDGRE